MNWTLTSIRLNDGAEALVLTDKRGLTVRAYAPGVEEYANIWTCYSFHFPIKEFTSREKCFQDAEKFVSPDTYVYKENSSGDTLP